VERERKGERLAKSQRQIRRENIDREAQRIMENYCKERERETERRRER